MLSSVFEPSSELAVEATLNRIDERGEFWGVSACTYAPGASGNERTMYRTLSTEVNVWGQGVALRCAAERLMAYARTGERRGRD